VSHEVLAFLRRPPLTNDQRLDQFYRRLHEYLLDDLMDKVQELDELIGMGEIPPYLRRQAS
jgi:hypothetical protein